MPTLSTPLLAMGVGCRREAPLAALQTLVKEALIRAGVSPQQVTMLATLEDKADEPAITTLAEHYGWPLMALSRAMLIRHEAQLTHHSAAVRARYGISGIAEAAALAAIHHESRSARLLLTRQHNRQATCALAINDTVMLSETHP